MGICAGCDIDMENCHINCTIRTLFKKKTHGKEVLPTDFETFRGQYIESDKLREKVYGPIKRFEE